MSDAFNEYYESDELTDEEWYEWRDKLQKKYNFYLTNPRDRPGMEYSLYVNSNGREYVFLSSNTLGYPTFHSRFTEIGDDIELTGDFFEALWMAVHDQLAFTPTAYSEDQFNNVIETAYGEKEPQHERWLVQVLSQDMVWNDEVIPELKPLYQWCDKHTKFHLL
jgi:hypothetical protein